MRFGGHVAPRAGGTEPYWRKARQGPGPTSSLEQGGSHCSRPNSHPTPGVRSQQGSVPVSSSQQAWGQPSSCPAPFQAPAPPAPPAALCPGPLHPHTSEIKASHPAPCLFWKLLSASLGAEPEAFCAPPGSQRTVDVARLGLEGACLLSGHSRPSVLSGKQTWPGGALCSGCLVRLGGRSLLPHLHLGTLVGAQWGLC